MRKFVPTTLAAAIVVGLGTLTTVSSPLVASEPSEATVATVAIGQRFIDVEASVNFESAVLRVAGPQGYALTRHVSVVDGPFITADLLLDAEPARFGGAAELQQRDFVPDGTYRYEIEFRTGDGSVEISTGAFRVEGGSAYELQPVEEEAAEDAPLSYKHDQTGLIGRVAGAVVDFVFPSAHAQSGDFDNFVSIRNTTGTGSSRLNLNATDSISIDADAWRLVNDDGTGHAFEIIEGTTGPRLVIQQGGNVGIGTETPQSRLHVNSGGGFQLRLTDGTNVTRLDAFGSRFAIYGTNGANQFRINGDAPSASQAIDADGNVGFGTATPAQKMHIVSEDVATRLRIDPTGSTWDLWAGSAGLWFVENDGSTTPLKLGNGAPNDSLVVSASGAIGLGTASPADPLHVRRAGGETAAVRVETVGGATANRRLFFLRNNGNPIFRFEDTSDAQKVWDFRLTESGFSITRVGSGALEMDLSNNGNVTFAGTVQGGSSRAIKHNIESLDRQDLLEKIERLQVTEWSYDAAPSERRIGPMAEDFHQIFGLGSSDKHIAPSDMAGVAIAAAQALTDRSKQLEAENAELRARLDRIEAAIASSRE